MNPSAYPKLNAVYHGFLKSPTYAAHIEANAALMMKVDTALGVASNFKYNITPMGDHVQPRLCNNLSLCQVSKPGDCITHKEVLTLIDLTMFIYSGMFQNDGEGVDSMETIKRLGVGPFVKNLANSTWGTLASEKTKGTAKFADLSSSFQSQDQFLAVVGDSSFPWPP
ncbi:hypothetical protein BG003_001095 [Podila horticola]|nr:hypothetical protein BG003_001095 [Podila horticola]